jgi:hypothetical protein
VNKIYVSKHHHHHHRPGGKYGPKVEEISKEEGQQLAVGEELKRAAEVVKASLKVRQR